MKKIVFIMMFFLMSSCYTIDQARDLRNKNFKEESLLTWWMVERIFPEGECDPQSFKQRCNDNYRQLCNARGQWENYESCGAKTCKAPEDQDLTVCQ
jgi:hypothetical protein